MTHRAESIIDTVKTRVTGLTTTGSNVFRGRVYPAQASELPGLWLYLGPDEPQADYSQDLIDSLLTVHIEAAVKSPTAQIDTELNKIREEVTIALQADYTQGLAYVIDTLEGEVAEPELSGEGEQPVGVLRMTWQFLYRRSRTDPGA